MVLELDLLRIVRIVTVVLALLLSWLAVNGYRKNKGKGLLFISIGFGIVSAGTAAEGILFEFFNYSILTVHLIESTVVALGLLFLVYAIYGAADRGANQ